MQRKVIQSNGATFLETKPGSGDFKLVTGQWGIFTWQPCGTYHLSDLVRAFAQERAADRFASRSNIAGKEYVVRTLRYVQAN